jgi:hypothetical protein
MIESDQTPPDEMRTVAEIRPEPEETGAVI